ncbi:HD domain-containing protein [Solibacillus sp. FSL K6-1523]|uniref:HD domain-containing protein n=1 Tax=Solibacillus sp. FSL K6-1523 TaxID=2921471 RepID=UPI0030FAFD61
MKAIESSKIYNKLLELSKDDSDVNSLVTIVENGVSYALDRTKIIIRYMDEYTLHDETHLHRVLTLMEKLIPESTLNNLKPLELSLLILSAYFHDLGMAPMEKEIKIYKGLISKEEKLSKEEEKMFEDFNLYCEAKVSLKHRIDHAYKNEDKGLARVLENHRVTEYIRINHGKKVKNIIQEIENNETWAMGLKYKNFGFGKYLSKICESHNENILEINNPLLSTSIPVASDEYLNSIFIAVVLRLADILDFDAERTPDVLYNHLDIRNPISMQEWQKHRSIQSWSISSERIMFAAECEHPAIEKTIKDFCNYIEEELYACKIVLNNMYDRQREDLKTIYDMPLPYEVETIEVRAKVDYDGNPIYIYKDLSFNLDQNEIIKLLMGTSLYGNSHVAFRELLQNAIDACRFRKICSVEWGDIGYKSIIKIKTFEDQGDYYFEITDNGIGMDEDIILNYFSNVGKSYYKSEEFLKFKTRVKSNFKPISNFGIGFLSCFMVADQIKVQTTKIVDRYKSSQALDLTLDSLSGLFYFNKGTRNEVGTKVILKLKKEHKITNNIAELKGYIANLVSFSDDIELYFNEELIETSEKQLIEDYEWGRKSNIGYYTLNICEFGISGKIKIALIEVDDLFYNSMIVDTNEVEGIELNEMIRISDNYIKQETDSIEFDGSTNSGWSSFIETEGNFYLKGILVEDSIFKSTDLWRRSYNNFNKIEWPFPVNFELNYDGEYNLNLNAARDKIILDEEWDKFKYTLTQIVLRNLVKHFDDVDKINSFKSVYKGSTDEYNEILEDVVNDRNKELMLV